MAGVGKPSKKLLFSSAKLNLASLITEKIKIRNEKYLRFVSYDSAIWKKRTVDGNAPKEIKSGVYKNGGIWTFNRFWWFGFSLW